jgi:hypothetical protein
MTEGLSPVTPGRPFYVLLLRYTKASSYEYIVLTRAEDHSIMAFKTLREACDYFESSWHRAHGTSLGHSTGAMLQFIQLSPKALGFMSLEELDEKLGMKPYKHVSFSGTAAHGTGMLCQSKDIEAIYERGKSPSLVPSQDQAQYEQAISRGGSHGNKDQEGEDLW